MPAGAELAAALHALPLAAVPNDRMLGVLRAHYRQLCHEQARFAAALVEVARCDGIPAPGVVSRTAGPDRYAEHESRAALRWTRSAAEAEHAMAEFVHGELPVVFAAWLAGDLDRPRVRIFEQYLFGLSADQIDAVCATAVPRAPGLTTGQLAALLRRMVIAVDPDAAARWYRKGVRERTVTAYLAPDGTATIAATGLPPDEAEAACRRIEDLAEAARRAGHPGRIGQIRSEVYLRLLDGRFHHLIRDEMIAALLADPRPEDRNPAGTDGNTPDDTGPDDTGPDDRPDGNPPDSGPGGGPSDDPPDNRPRGSSPAGDPDNGSPDTDTTERSSPGGDSPDGDTSTAAPDSAPDTAPPAPAAGARRDQRQGIEIRVGLSTLLGLDDHPGEIPGLGPVLASVARSRVATQPRARWRFAVIGSAGQLLSEGLIRRRPHGTSRSGPVGGIVELQLPEALLRDLAADPARGGRWSAVVADIAAQHTRRDRHLHDLDARPGDRFPGAGLRRHTEIRDRTCTFAGVCRRPARASAQDHARDKASRGPTTRSNLGPVCHYDHAVKHRAGWTVTRDDDAAIWHSPLGGHYPARGEFLHPDLPVPTPDPDALWARDARNDPVPPTGVDEQPILCRPPPSGTDEPPPAPPAPPQGPLDDDPPPF